MSEQSLATRAVRGAFWTGGGIALQMVVILVFFRELRLADMGMFDWAQRMAMLASLIGALGMNEALVQLKNARDDHFAAAFWGCFVLGCALAGLLAWGAPVLTAWVGHWIPNIDASAFARTLRPMTLMIPIASVSGVLRAILARDLRFRAIAVSEVTAVVAAGAVGLGLLSQGFGIWSVIGNALAREAAMLASLWLLAAWWPGFSFRWGAFRELMRFGFNVAGANALNYVNNNLDKLFFVPILLGARANGLYSFAYRYTMMPLTRAAMILTRVSFPTFSKVQDDDAALRRAYLRTVGMVALAAWPVLAGGFVYAPEFLMLIKGEAMLDALVPLRLLIVAGMLKAVGTVVGSIFLAKGKAHWSFRWTVVNLVVFVLGLTWGVRYGLDGVAAVLSAASLLFLVVTQALVNRLIRLRLMSYLRALAMPALIAVLAGGFLWGVHTPPAFGSLGSLLLGIAFGGAIYLVAIRLFAWTLVMGFWRDFRGRQ